VATGRGGTEATIGAAAGGVDTGGTATGGVVTGGETGGAVTDGETGEATTGGAAAGGVVAAVIAGAANDGVSSGGSGGSSCAWPSGGASEIGDESRRGFGGGASLRPGGCESCRVRPGAEGGSDVGCEGGMIRCCPEAIAGAGVVTSSEAESSRFVMSGVDGIGTRAGGAVTYVCEGGGPLGVPTEITG
jgi:hypothetical protein